MNFPNEIPPVFIETRKEGPMDLGTHVRRLREATLEAEHRRETAAYHRARAELVTGREHVELVEAAAHWSALAQEADSELHVLEDTWPVPPLRKPGAETVDAAWVSYDCAACGHSTIDRSTAPSTCRRCGGAVQLWTL